MTTKCFGDKLTSFYEFLNVNTLKAEMKLWRQPRKMSLALELQ